VPGRFKIDIFNSFFSLPACQNSFALKKLGSTPGQEERYGDQDDDGNDRHLYGELKLA
jgi:hypothetical protein